MSGSSTGVCRSRDEPSSLHKAAPSSRLVVSIIARFPASATTGSGCGVRSSQMPPSADAAIRSRSSSSPARPCHDWADTWTARPSERARSYSCHTGSRRDTALNSSTASSTSGARSPGRPVPCATWLASRSTSVLACASATAISAVPSTMQYQTSASAKLPGPSRPVPSRRNSARNRSATSATCRADERIRASSPSCRPVPYATASQPGSSRPRKSAVLRGGPAGADTASDTTASITSV